MFGKFDHRACQQLERPAGTALRGTGTGGRHQQGFFLSGEFAFRSGTRLFAQRPLQIAFHEASLDTVEPLTPTLLATSSSLVPASAASKICARLSLRDACLPPLSSALSSVRSIRLSPTRQRTFVACLLVRGTHEQLNRMAGLSPSTKPFTPTQGSIWLLSTSITRLHRRPPAETDMQEYFRVSPPSVHQMVLTLERVGLIRRQPRTPRSIEVIIDPKLLPELI